MLVNDSVYSWDEDGNMVITKYNGKIKITPNNIYIKDKYGNILRFDEAKLIYQQNSPTYDELYEHWLKTKQND